MKIDFRKNLTDLINSSEVHHLKPEENVKDVLESIDYYLIISSPEAAEKFGIEALLDDYFPSELILCIKKDMTAKVIYTKI